MKTTKRLFHTIILIIMVLNGLLLTTNIYVIGNPAAAIEMHDDLPRNASDYLAITKVIVCFITGILYLIAAYGLIKKKYKLVLSGFIGFIIFDGEYIYQIINWSNEHPRMFVDFSILVQ